MDPLKARPPLPARPDPDDRANNGADTGTRSADAPAHGAECRRETVMLGPAERLVLWGVRVFAAGLRTGRPVLEVVRENFGQAMAGPAVEPLQAAILFIAEGACRPVEVKCPRCPAQSRDEAVIMRLIALGQAGDDISTLFLARDMLTPAAARVAGPVFRMVGAALARCHIHLPPVQDGGTPAGARPFGAPPAHLILPERDTVH